MYIITGASTKILLGVKPLQEVILLMQGNNHPTNNLLYLAALLPVQIILLLIIVQRLLKRMAGGLVRNTSFRKALGVQLGLGDDRDVLDLDVADGGRGVVRLDLQRLGVVPRPHADSVAIESERTVAARTPRRRLRLTAAASP